jgi:hypothetical protein
MSKTYSLQPGLAALRGAVGTSGEGDGLLIAVLGRLSQAEARAMSSIRRGTATCVAVLVDVAGPDVTGRAGDAAVPEGAPAGAQQAAHPPARLLRAAGWRVLTISSAAALATAWAHADQAAEELSRTTVRDGRVRS